MRAGITLNFLWVPPEFGGHSVGPYSGMRLTIRWQRFIEEYLKCAHDVKCEIYEFDPITLRGTAFCTLSNLDGIPSGWLQDGQLVELLSGFRVLAVGRITEDGIDV